MKTRLLFAQVALAGVVGCNGRSGPLSNPAPRSESNSVAASSDNPAGTLVSLKVPNMH